MLPRQDKPKWDGLTWVAGRTRNLLHLYRGVFRVKSVRQSEDFFSFAKIFTRRFWAKSVKDSGPPLCAVDVLQHHWRSNAQS